MNTRTFFLSFLRNLIQDRLVFVAMRPEINFS